MAKRDIVVIGASAGGVVALLNLVKTIPDDFDATIFIVQHISPFSPSILPQILSKANSLKAVHPKDGEQFRKRHIYIAPPDHHLLIEGDRVLVKKGPKENRFRPSIDALFRSAAYNYGSRVIGVVLSGLLDDGTSGLWTVKRQSGIVVIQDPGDAEFPSMPKNVLEHVDVDHSVPIDEMAALLNELTKQAAPEETPGLSKEETDLLQAEINIASKDNSFNMGIIEKGGLTPLTCPECSGSLVQFKEGKLVRFRCHTGHAFTDSALLAGFTQAIEENLWKTVRGMEETIMLLERLSQQYEEAGKQEEAQKFSGKAKQTRKQSELIRNQIFVQERLSEDLRFNGSANGNG